MDMRKTTVIALSLILVFTTFQIKPAAAVDLWFQFGIYGEPEPTIVIGTPGFSASPDLCFDIDGRQHLVWADTLNYSTNYSMFTPVHMWFNGYSFRGDRKGQRTLRYIDLYFKISATPKITTLRDGRLLAVWATVWGTNSNLYWSVLGTLPWQNWSPPQPVNNTTENVVESMPDLIPCTNSNNAWLTYTKEDKKGKKFVVVAKFNGNGWDRLANDSIGSPGWGSLVESDKDCFASKVVELNDDEPAVFFESLVSTSNSDIFCSRWNSSLGRWYYYNNFTEGFQNISNSSRPSHTPDVTMDSLNRPVLVWNESYTTGQESGVAYCSWNGNWVNLNNLPGFSMITTDDGKGSAVSPTITLDSNNRGMVAFNMFDKNGLLEKACFTFYSAGGFVNPLTGMKGYGWIKSDYYSEFTDCSIFANPDDPDSPIIIGTSKSPKNLLLATRNNRDTNIFYAVLKKNPSDVEGNRMTFLTRPFDVPYQPASWYSIKTTEAKTDFFWKNKDGLGAGEMLYIFFNTTYRFDGNPWGTNTFSSDYLTKTRWTAWDFQWWNPNRPGIDKWDGSYPWSSFFIPEIRAIRARNLYDRNNFRFTASIATTPLTYFEYPEFFYCEVFVSTTDYYPNVYNPVSQNLTFNPPFIGTNDNSSYAFAGFTNIASQEFFVIDPEYVEVDQGSYSSVNFIVYNPNGTSGTTMTKFRYVLTEMTGVSDQGLYVGFYPNNVEIDSQPYSVGAVIVSASQNAKPIIYNLQVLCEITMPGNNYPIYLMNRLTVRVRAYDLTVKKMVNKSRADIGETIEYTIMVRNHGDGQAKNIQVYDNLPRELELVSASDDGFQQGSKVIWFIDKIDGGQAISLKLYVKVRTDLNLSNGDLIINSAYLSSGKGSQETSVGVFIQTYLPGCPIPQVEFRLRNASGSDSVKAGDLIEGTFNVTEGCGPFDSVVNWGDGTKPTRLVIDSSGQAKVSYTYQTPGDYTIFIQVNDIYGKCANVYKRIRIN
jgi:uncharacterized repeat protein (TIGR01451 family)